MGRSAFIVFCLLGAVSCDDESGASEPSVSADVGPVDAGADTAPMGDGSPDVLPADAAPVVPDARPDASDAQPPDAGPMRPPDAAPMPLDPQADCMQQPTAVPPTLSEDLINGQRIIYSDTPTALGILLLFHGNGGSPDIWVDQTEHIIMTQAALDRGLLVIALKSVEGGWDKRCCDGEERCCESGDCCTDNVDDVRNVRDAIRFLEEAGLAPAGVPVYALGYSNGGGFTGRLTQGIRLAAAATVNSGSSGPILAATDDLPPMFFQGAAEDPIVDPGRPRRNYDSFVDRGIRTALRINEPAPLTPGRLSRIHGISCEQSIDLYDGMGSLGLVDEDGMLTGTVDETMEALEAHPFWQNNGLEAHSRNVTLQLRELAAAHPLSAEWVDEIMDFLLADAP